MYILYKYLYISQSMNIISKTIMSACLARPNIISSGRSCSSSHMHIHRLCVVSCIYPVRGRVNLSVCHLHTAFECFKVRAAKAMRSRASKSSSLSIVNSSASCVTIFICNSSRCLCCFAQGTLTH